MGPFHFKWWDNMFFDDSHKQSLKEVLANGHFFTEFYSDKVHKIDDTGVHTDIATDKIKAHEQERAQWVIPHATKSTWPEYESPG